MLRPLMRSRTVNLLAALLLLIFAAEITLSIRQQSLSWDEGDHLFAGYMSWKRMDFGLNPEHPPMVKALAAIPLLFMDLKIPPSKGLADFKAETYFDGRDLIYHSGGIALADQIIFRARLAAGTLSLLLGLLVFLAAREMFGDSAALFALTLLVFEPNLIAHGAYVTTDMGLSCLMFASIYAFYRYAKAPSWKRVVLIGLAAGLALGAKHSAVLLLPMGLVLVVTEIVWPVSGGVRGETRKQVAVRLAGSFAAVAVIAVMVLWSFYGFRYAARPGGVPLHISLVEYAQGLHGIEPKVYLALARAHLLPESYLYGLIDVRLVSNWFPSYILGQTHYHGVWFYFPVAFVIKSTAAFMALMLVAGFAIAVRKLGGRREILFLTLPPLVYLLFAVGTGLNIGARHILPMYAFLCVLIGGAVVGLARTERRWGYVAAVLLLWHVVSTSRAYPVYLAYSNEFWGGPANTYKYLTDSNVDWGQQLHGVKQYVDARGIKDCWFAYFVQPAIDFRDYGIPCQVLPTQDEIWFHGTADTPATIQGTVFISAGTLTGYEMGSNVMNPYRQFQSVTPTAVIQRGVFVYDGTFDMRSASALGHVMRNYELTEAKRLEEALAEAHSAVQIDPESFQGQLALGDTLVALGREAEAKPAYEHALGIAKTMEPSSSAAWVEQIQKKLQ